MSSDDSSSESSFEEYVATRRAPTRAQSMLAAPTYKCTEKTPQKKHSQRNSRMVSDSDSSENSSDDEDSNKKKVPCRKAPPRAASVPVVMQSWSYRDDTTLLISKQAVDMAESLRNTLDISLHSNQNDVEDVIDFTSEVDEFKMIKLGSIVNSKKKKEPVVEEGVLFRDLGKLSLEAKKEARMERVRQRIEAEEDKKEQEKYEARMKEIEAAKTDMSEAARRKRCWEWYNRIGMVTKMQFIEKLPCLSHVAALEESDVELLPWNARGTMVNVAKLNCMLSSS